MYNVKCCVEGAFVQCDRSRMRQTTCITSEVREHAARVSSMLGVSARKTRILVLTAMLLAVVGRIVADAESKGVDPEVNYDAVCGEPAAMYKADISHVALLHSQIQLITSKGYPAEAHNVTTSDGYILELHRIPHGLRRSKSTGELYSSLCKLCYCKRAGL